MGRAHGRNHPRQIEPKGSTPELANLTPEQIAEYGKEPERNIPGDDTHLVNYTTKHAVVPVGDKLPEFRGMDAHGVPVSPATHYDRPAIPGAGHRRAPAPRTAPEAHKVTPVPVYIVAEDGGGKALRSASPGNVQLNASGNEATRICGKDPSRSYVLLLNESSSSNIRFARHPGDLTSGPAGLGGGLLPWPSSSYLRVHTQDELWAVSADSGTPVISVIQVHEIAGAG